MFDRISRRYDLLNRVLSLGLDRGWRRRLVDALELPPGARVLDLATGTGDVALALLRLRPGIEVVGLDPSRRMLELARTKLRPRTQVRPRAKPRRGESSRCWLSEGVAEALPFRDRTFDAVTMAFGIRNVPERERALRDIARVLRPGGRLGILELAEPRAGWVAPFSRFWVRRVVPRVGAMLASAAEYSYLERSMTKFPPPEQFARVLRASGLEVLAVEPLGLGACTLFLAERPTAAAGETS